MDIHKRKVDCILHFVPKEKQVCNSILREYNGDTKRTCGTGSHNYPNTGVENYSFRNYYWFVFRMNQFCCGHESKMLAKRIIEFSRSKAKAASS